MKIKYYLKCTRSQFWQMLDILVRLDRFETGGRIFGQVVQYSAHQVVLGQGPAWTITALDDHGKMRLEADVPGGDHPPALQTILGEVRGRGWLKHPGPRPSLVYDEAFAKWDEGGGDMPLEKVVQWVNSNKDPAIKKRTYDRTRKALLSRKKKNTT